MSPDDRALLHGIALRLPPPPNGHQPLAVDISEGQWIRLHKYGVSAVEAYLSTILPADYGGYSVSIRAGILSMGFELGGRPRPTPAQWEAAISAALKLKEKIDAT